MIHRNKRTFIKTIHTRNLPIIEKNNNKLILPFNNEWTVVWGGDTKEDNYHVAVQSQKNAFDFVILKILMEIV